MKEMKPDSTAVSTIGLKSFDVVEKMEGNASRKGKGGIGPSRSLG